MRFESLTAYAFGPFAGPSGGKTLRFAPGMNVVHGPNESGKSSLHAALYAGLCGQRRGRQTNEEKDFRDHHAPWDVAEWDVAAVVTLAGGKRLELRHNLISRTCHVVDELTGQPYGTAEIEFEGAPDGSRLLGLDRRAFLATACVRQSDLLGVLDNPSQLHEHLQRAAATSGADETAATALRQIDHFQRTNVGSTRANAIGPLRQAQRQLQECTDRLRLAREEHARYLDLAAHADELERRAAAAGRALRLAEAKLARVEAERHRGRLKRAHELAARFPDGAPAGGADDDAVAQESASALATWAALPATPTLDGETSDEIRARIADLPPHPQGDTQVHPEVAHARATLDAAILTVHGHDAAAATPRPFRTSHPLRLPLLAAGGLAVVVAVVALATGALTVGLALLLLGAALAGAGLFLKPPALDEVSRAAARQGHLSAQSTAAAGLASVLRARGVDVTGDPLEAFARYARECAARSEQASRAAQRVELERLLGDREQRETDAAQVRATRTAALERLRRSAVQCGCADADTLDGAELAVRIERWRTERANAMRDRDRAQQEWADLQALLDGKTLDELDAEVGRVDERAAASAAGLESPEIEAFALEPDPQAHVSRLRLARDASAGQSREASGQVHLLLQSVPDVAAAEEAEVEAREELARVEQLERTLTLTVDFLRTAQENVHRSIAPVLQASIERWLPAVTAGRYREARVDPESLRVTVRDHNNQLRDAAMLSHGTAEQIYLLLRAAMAQHLTKEGEICPLILDDVTVHCDAFRKPQVLAALHALSEERQIILFTQEEPVLAWAEATLEAERDHIERLDAAPLPLSV